MISWNNTSGRNKMKFYHYLPKPIKRTGRFIQNCYNNPHRIKQYLNLFKCEWRMHKNTRLSFVPPVLVATVTKRCNLRCPTCQYVLEGKGLDYNGESLDEPNSFSAMLDTIDPERKALILYIAGGEPFLSNNLEAFIMEGKSRGYAVNISTNGTLLKGREQAIKQLDHINISIDGYDKESYHIARGDNHQTFQKVMDGIKILKESGVRFSLSFILHKENVATAPEMIAFAERVGAAEIMFHNINPHGSDYSPLDTSQEETMEVITNIQKRNDYRCDVYMPYIFDIGTKEFRETKCIQPWFYRCFDMAGNLAKCCQLPHNTTFGKISNGHLTDNLMDIIRWKIIKEREFGGGCLFCQRRFMDIPVPKYLAGDGWQ